MNPKAVGMLLVLAAAVFVCCRMKPGGPPEFRYGIRRLKGSMRIDADWDKPQWRRVPSVAIEHAMGNKPGFLPKTRAKVLYDDANLYVIFRVEDRYVRAVASGFHGRVWEDACVEFFFAPDAAEPLKYFNVEMNCGGAALMSFNRAPETDHTSLAGDDMRQIEIAHSLPGRIDPEIAEPVTWTLEYRIPLSILEKYAPLTKPEKGVVWRANFQKCAETNSHPHWLTWAKIDYPEPRFHLPQFFGTIEFVE